MKLSFFRLYGDEVAEETAAEEMPVAEEVEATMGSDYVHVSSVEELRAAIESIDTFSVSQLKHLLADLVWLLLLIVLLLFIIIIIMKGHRIKNESRNICWEERIEGVCVEVADGAIKHSFGASLKVKCFLCIDFCLSCFFFDEIKLVFDELHQQGVN